MIDVEPTLRVWKMGEQTQITDKYQKLSENRLSYGPVDS